MRQVLSILCILVLTPLAKAGFIFDTIPGTNATMTAMALDSGSAGNPSILQSTEAGQPFTAGAYTGIGSIDLPVDVWSQPNGPGSYGNGSITLTMNVRTLTGGVPGAPIWSQTQTLNYGPQYNSASPPTAETLHFTTGGGLAVPANVPLLYSLQIGSYSTLPNVMLEQQGNYTASGQFWTNLTSTSATSAGLPAGWNYVGSTAAQMRMAAQSLAPGDVDGSFFLDAHDILAIQSAGKYGQNVAATWKNGDFDGDGRVTAKDILLVQSSNLYNKGNYSASPSVSTASAAKNSFRSLALSVASLTYNPLTGDVSLNTGGVNLNGLVADSAGHYFIAGSALFPTGSTLNENTTSELATFTFGSNFGNFDFGDILPKNLSTNLVESDLSGTYTIDGQSGENAIAIDVSSTPEPTSFAIGIVFASAVLLRRTRHANP